MALLVLFLWGAGSSFAGVVPLVQSVDFYPNGAKFTFRVEAEKGNFDFSLPGAFEEESLRCLTRGSLTSLKTDSFPVKESPAPELQPLRKKMQDAERVVRLLEAREATLKQALLMFQHNPFPTPTSKANDGDSGTVLWGPAWIDYIARVKKGRLDAATEMVELNGTLLKAREDFGEAQENFEILRQNLERRKPHNASRTLRVSGTTSSASTTLLFEAYTPAAGWRVEHEMDMNGDTGDIEAKMSALAYQNTGLNIEGEFAFHTRRPTSSVNPPDINPLIVTLRTSPVALGRRQMNEEYFAGTGSLSRQMADRMENIPGYVMSKQPEHASTESAPIVPMPDVISSRWASSSCKAFPY